MRVYFEMCHNIWNVILDASKVYAHHMVRTDSKAQKLDAFLQRRPSEAGSQVSRHEADMESNTGDISRGVADTATASSGVPARCVVKLLQLCRLAMSHNSIAPLHIACMHSVGYLLIRPCPLLYHTFPVLDVSLLGLL